LRDKRRLGNPARQRHFLLEEKGKEEIRVSGVDDGSA
jgi:hypothetical protein